MKTLLRSGIFVALALGAGAVCASAGTISYTTALSGANETPGNASPATGFATLNLTNNSLAVDIVFSGLTAAASASHIHCCGAPGTNFAVALPFTLFPSATSGHYTATYDLTLTATYSNAFLTSSGGTAAGAEAALIAGLNAGTDYVNIHDANFPGGEIRGFAQTPEPGTLFLGGAALLGLIVRRRR